MNTAKFQSGIAQSPLNTGNGMVEIAVIFYCPRDELNLNASLYWASLFGGTVAQFAQVQREQKKRDTHNQLAKPLKKTNASI